ncbi:MULTISPECIES: hypothetical protein [unclassified Burkholderia]|uniref:hypothetical protein n=1 Tax=unclassified Burkholderia TaxID=2613784 RepID=UPI002AB1E91D|nr:MULTISPECIES: hypothetical protein [unclassified Burkholderia]
MSAPYEIFGRISVDVSSIGVAQEKLAALLHRYLESTHVARESGAANAMPNHGMAGLRFSASGLIGADVAAAVTENVQEFAEHFSQALTEVEVCFVGERRRLIVGPGAEAAGRRRISEIDGQIAKLVEERAQLQVRAVLGRSATLAEVAGLGPAVARVALEALSNAYSQCLPAERARSADVDAHMGEADRDGEEEEYQSAHCAP